MNFGKKENAESFSSGESRVKTAKGILINIIYIYIYDMKKYVL